MADGDTKDTNAIGDKLIAAACKMFGIGQKFVVGSRYDDQTAEAIIVTAGGKKVRFKDGDEVEKLSQLEITGINPSPARKPIAGAAKK